MTGNQRRELVTLHHRVKSVYGPVLNWTSTIDPNHPERFGTDAFVIECEKLDVAKVGQTREGQAAMVLSGEGNTLIIGSDFSARCRNLHYESSKDQLVLSGDGRAPATFYRNQQLGSKPLDFSAARILYYPKTQMLNVDKFQSLDVQDLQSQKPSSKPATR
jgi:lipopolysaccharide export system protein LptA